MKFAIKNNNLGGQILYKCPVKSNVVKYPTVAYPWKFTEMEKKLKFPPNLTIENKHGNLEIVLKISKLKTKIEIYKNSWKFQDFYILLKISKNRSNSENRKIERNQTWF